MKKRSKWGISIKKLNRFLLYLKKDKLGLMVAITSIMLIILVIYELSDLYRHKKRWVDTSEIQELSNHDMVDNTASNEKTVSTPKKSVFESENTAYGNDMVKLAENKDTKEGYMNNCIFLGDSRTVAMVNYGFINDDCALAKIGITHSQAMKSTFTQNSGKQYMLSSYLDTHQYPVVYVNFGVNGIGYTPMEKFQQDYEELLDFIIELVPNSNVVIMGIWPVDDYGVYSEIVTNEKIDEFNDYLYGLAKKKCIYYLDVETTLKDENGQIKQSFNAGDGLHYSSNGYKTILDYIIHHPVPGISDAGEYRVNYIPPSTEKQKENSVLQEEGSGFEITDFQVTNEASNGDTDELEEGSGFGTTDSMVTNEAPEGDIEELEQEAYLPEQDVALDNTGTVPESTISVIETEQDNMEINMDTEEGISG